MKAVVGVDEHGNYQNALGLFNRLAFERSNVELVHVDEAIPVGGASVAPFDYVSYQLADSDRRGAGKRVLEAAEQQIASAGVSGTVVCGLGNPSETLSRRADEIHADLIVVGSSRKTPYGALFLGSVGRRLTIAAHRSILVSKHPVQARGKLTAVFATDCSQYADECLQIFIRMHATGIGRILVVSAVPHFEFGNAPSHLCHHVNQLVGHLRDEGYDVSGVVMEGHPAEVIDEQMRSTEADLLIMGAQGHGFVERLLVGSLSLQEVVATPHSVLLLRSR